MIGQTLGHYKILDKLGAGGMGEVYRAEDTTLDREVALKILPPELAESQERLSRFQREAKSLAALDHPNIVHVYSVEEDEGTHFITMELVEGRPLSHLIKRGGLPLEQIFEIAIPLADALATAHEKGVIHRDLKPANIMVNDEGRVKVLDFGLAKLRDEDQAPFSSKLPTEPLTEEGRIIGTIPYASPEQLEGSAVDARSDIFSLGAVLYEMATGQRAFPGESSASVIVAIMHSDPQELDEVRPELPHHLGRIIRLCLKKKPGHRFQTARDVRNELIELREEVHLSSRPNQPRAPEEPGQHRRVPVRFALRFLAVLALGLVAITLIRVLGGGEATALSDADEILVTDFVNRTGDSTFDGTLDHALAVKLEESPFLLISPEAGVRETMRYMGRDPDDAITPEIGREACQRQGIKAMITGEIAPMGSNYVVSLSAIECEKGMTLSRELVEAGGKEDVISALGRATTEMRKDLGETLTSVQRFDAPLEQTTTSSLEALKAFSRADKLRSSGHEGQAIPLLNRAIELDPEFAQAYGALGTIYGNLREWEASREYLTRAYELRDRVSERERFYITAHYHDSVTGDVDKQLQTYEQFKRSYPRDWTPRNNLAVQYNDMGWYERAVEESRVAVQLNPNHAYPFSNLAEALRSLGQLAEAKEVYTEAQEKGFTYHELYIGSYLIALQEGDEATVQSMEESLTGKPGEAWMLATQAKVAASAGRLNQARELTGKAVEVANHFGFTVQSAFFLAEAAAFESALDNYQRSQELALEVLDMVRNRDTMPYAAAILARAGAIGEAEALVEELTVRFPEDTIINSVQIPLAESLIALRQGDPKTAIDKLESAVPYEKSRLWTIYQRGLAYLMASQPSKAMAKFQRLRDLRSVQPDNTVHTLAHLGLARANAAAGDLQGAQEGYRAFFEIIAEADAGVPLIETARAEHEALLEKYGQEG